MRAISLFSGGLDSLLAIELIKRQNIEVIALNFDTGFGSIDDKSYQLKKMLSQIDTELEIIDIKDKFIEKILFNPQYGYGKNFNPCIDCHGYMITIAKSLMQKFKADFIISGEVLGQRPMSQTKKALNNVSKLSDENGLLLRPLSAKLLPETIPEREGWIDRERLLDINGRSRDRQLKLAKEFGIENFESPAGGCLLTDIAFSQKLSEYVKFDSKFRVEDINILKYGRQFRLPDGAKLIIGRNQKDNEKIEAIKNSKFQPLLLKDVVGPISLLSKNSTKSDLKLACKLALTYSRAEVEREYCLNFKDRELKESRFESKEIAKRYMVLKN